MLSLCKGLKRGYTQSSGTNWNHDWVSGVADIVTTDETLSTVHSNRTDDILAEMLLRWRSVDVVVARVELRAYRDLEHKPLATVASLESVENRRELVGIELDCITHQHCDPSLLFVFQACVRSCGASCCRRSNFAPRGRDDLPSTTAPMTCRKLATRYSPGESNCILDESCPGEHCRCWRSAPQRP